VGCHAHALEISTSNTWDSDNYLQSTDENDLTTSRLTTMSFAPRTTTIRPSSGLGLGGSQNSQSSALQARIHEKKSELESLRQLRDLSAGLAGQMQQLEEKLGTLSDGTEAVAAVMANWGSVLRAVSMASGKWMMVVSGEVVYMWTMD
jgi:DASH complex subunit DAD2